MNIKIVILNVPKHCNKYDLIHFVTATELKVTQSALDVHMGCMPFVKDW